MASTVRAYSAMRPSQPVARSANSGEKRRVISI